MTKLRELNSKQDPIGIMKKRDKKNIKKNAVKLAGVYASMTEIKSIKKKEAVKVAKKVLKENDKEKVAAER